MDFELRKTSSDSLETAYTLTRELMEHHNALSIFTMTVHRMGELIESGLLHSYIVYSGEEAVGVMNFFFKLTTFTGRKILYIEDFYARKEVRGKGTGTFMLDKVKEFAAENDCEQIELKCALWNTPSAGFYEAKGLTADNSWVTYTMDRIHFCNTEGSV